MSANPLIGTWKLISCVNHAADGTISYPFGENPRGYIFYRDDGFMSVEMMRPDRPNFEKNDIWTGSEQEDSKALKSYLSYAGKYTFKGDHVVHHIEVSSFPNWSDQDQVRYVNLKGFQLTLKTPPTSFAGETRTGEVVWRKLA